MNSLIIAALLGFGAQTEPTITYTCPGKNAKAVFEDLSKQAGQTLLIGGSLADEPVVLRLDRAPLSKTMENLAFALNGDWVKEREGTRLIARKPVKDEDALRREKQIREDQKIALDELSKSSNFDSNAAIGLMVKLDVYLNKIADATTDPFSSENLDLGRQFTNVGPYGNLGNQVFTILSPKELALVTKTNRVVWSTSPTRMQRPLPNSIWNVVEQFKEGVGLWNQAIGNRQFKADMSRGVVGGVFHLVKNNIAGRPIQEPGDLDIRQVLVVGTCTGTVLDQLEVILVDSTGKFVEQVSLAAHKSYLNRSNNLTLDRPPPRTEKFELSDSALAFNRLIASTMSDFGPDGIELPGRRIQPTAEQILELTNPTKFDPLSLVVGEALVAYSKAIGKQMVIVPEENWLSIPFDANTRSVQASRIDDWFSLSGFKFSKDVGWQAGLPDPDPEVVRLTPSLNRCRRTTLQQFLKESYGMRRFTIESAAKFASQQSFSEYKSWQPALHFAANCLDIDQSLQESDSAKEALWFFGSLTPDRQRMMLQGETIRFDQLSMPQKAAISQFVFHSRINSIFYTFRSPDGKSTSNRNYGSIETEPTFHFANGIPENAILKFKLENTTSIQAKSLVDGRTITIQDSPKSLGLNLFAASLDPASRKYYLQLSDFVAQEKRVLKMAMQLDNMANFELQAIEIVGKSKPVATWNELPSHIAKEIQTEMERLAKKPPLEVKK